jgi:ABC-type transport system involved in multi-copper enzyme maturation permease subunit
MISNPIVQRDLVSLLRTRKAMAIQVAIVVALGTLVILRWPSDGRVDLSGARSLQVLRVFGYGLMAGLILLAPIFAATSIVREKVQGTLALLLNSPLGPVSIVGGKLISVLGFIVLMVILSLPAAAASFAMGGIDLYTQLGPMYLVLILLAVQYATLGLLVSSYASTTDSALRLTYGIILVLTVVVMGPHQFLQGQPGLVDSFAAAVDWLRCVSPVPAMMQLLGDSGVGSGGLGEAGNLIKSYAILAGASCIICVIWTTFRMNMRILDSARAAGKVTDDRSLGARTYRRAMYLWFFDPQRRSGMIGPWANPVMVKEQRCRRFGRGNWMMRLIGGCLIVSLLLVLVGTKQSIISGVETIGGIMVMLQISLVILLTPSLASGIISSERECGGWQLLQMTPLSALTIISGKLLSVMVPLLLVLLATLPAYAVMIWLDPGQMFIAINVMISLALTALLALLSSAAISSLCKQTAVATTISYVALVALCGGTMLFWLGQDAPFSRQTVEYVLMANPLAGALNMMDVPGFTDYQLVPANWWIVGGLCVVSLLVLVVQTWRLTRPR